MNANCKIVLEYVGGDYWELHLPVTYNEITAEVGFRTDLCSIPRLMWWLLPPFGRYIRAAIIHDWLIFTEHEPLETDNLFLEICLKDGVPKFIAYTFYLLVRLHTMLRNHKAS